MRRRRTKPVPTYQAENTQAADIILADPARYGGVLLEWAELWRKKSAATEKVALNGRSPRRVTPAIESERNNSEQHQLFPS